MRSYDSCVLTDPPTLICIKHNGDEEPEVYLCVLYCSQHELTGFYNRVGVCLLCGTD
jgi:hypothetical protein